MINLIYTPQRADIKAEYIVNGDVLTVKIGKVSEVFDFTGLPEGRAEEIVAEHLPVNPVISAEKIEDVVNVIVIRFYGADEKHLFEKHLLEGDIYG